MENLELFKLLGDATRLSIIRMLAREDSFVELIASSLSLTPATVCYHLKKLESAGLVRCSRSQFYKIYALNREIFDRSLAELILAAELPIDPEEKYCREVIAAFIKGGRLVSIPVQQKKREVILRHILTRFEIGRDYDEREVNAILTEFHEDYCTLRREMISFGLMARDHETYRVIGK